MVKGILALVLCGLLTVIAGSVAHAATGIVISEVQTTGCREHQLQNPEVCAVDEGAGEFVELTNTNVEDIDVSGWRIEYLSASHSGDGAPTRVISELNGRLMAGSSLLASFEGYIQNADIYFGTATSTGFMAKSGGHVRIVTSDGVVVDQFGWGTAQSLGWPKTTEVSAGSSATRIYPDDPLYSPASPFVIVKNTTPSAGGLQPWECEGVILSEILPNPNGVDSGNEFIELFNPTTETKRLNGCSVRLNEGEEYTFTSEVIAPGEYIALSDAQLGFSLPNSSGATVWLISATDEQGVQYPANMGDGEAWAFVSNAWQLSTTATKNGANKLTNVATEDKDEASKSSLLPCPSGKYRNPETNRCRSIASASSAALSPCKPGQIRNSETNRCRSATAASASLTPCKLGQVRNLETNRCRSATAASSTLKPCKPGQERSPETNRCRKSTAADGDANYKVEKTPATPGAPLGWFVAGTAGAGVLSYGAYEWRREIGAFFGKLKDKVAGSGPS
jgi:hypothetical protein